MSEVSDWFKSIPPITKYWFAVSVVAAMISRMGFISAYHLILWPPGFIGQFQVSDGAHVFVFLWFSFSNGSYLRNTRLEAILAPAGLPEW